MLSQFSRFGKFGVGTCFNHDLGGGGPLPTAPAAVPAAAPPANPATPQTSGGILDPRGPEGSPHPGSFEAPAAVTAPPAAVPTAQPAVPAAEEGLAANPGAVIPPANDPNAAAAPKTAREIAAQLGFGAAASFGDDTTFVQTVLAHANQAEAYRMQALQLQQQLIALSTGQNQPAAAAPATPAAPQAGKFWNPPEYNPAWEGLVTKGADGQLALAPGTPADVLPKYIAYHAHKRDFAEKLLSNPEATLAPLIAAQAEAKAREIIQKETATRDETTYVQSFIRENSDWLHQRDVSGRVVTAANGAPVLSPIGQAFQAHVNQAQQLGIRDARGQEQYARNMLRSDILAQQQAQAAQAAAAQQSVTAANRRPNASGTIPQPGVPAVAMPGMSLRDQMALAMREMGITDDAVNAGMG